MKGGSRRLRLFLENKQRIIFTGKGIISMQIDKPQTSDTHSEAFNSTEYLEGTE